MNRESTLMKLLAVTAMSIAMLVNNQEARASGRAACPGADVGVGKGVGILPTKSNDMHGGIVAAGATRCTIKFYGNHKTAPYCMVSGPEFYHIDARVLRTSPTEVTFTFDPPLTETTEVDYTCVFKD